MNKRKSFSVFLASLMFCGTTISTVGCSLFNKDEDVVVKNEIVEVSESDPWFDGTRLELGKEFYDMDLDMLYFNNAEIIDDKIVLLVCGYYPYDEANPIEYNCCTVDESDTSFAGEEEIVSIDVEADESEEKELEEDDVESIVDCETTDLEIQDDCYNAIVCYDMEGKQLWLTELNEFNTLDKDSSTQVDSIEVRGGNLKLVVGNYEYDSGDINYEYYDVDMSSGDIGSNLTSNEVEKFSLVNDYTNKECEYDFGNSIVVSYYSFSEDYMQCSYIIQIIKDGKADTIELSDVIDCEIYGVNKIIEWSDNEVLAILWTEEGCGLIKINTDSIEAEPLELSEDFKKIENDMFRLVDIDGTLYITEEDGLSKVDFATGTYENIFSFSECNAKLSEISYMQPYVVSDNEFVFAGNCVNGAMSPRGVDEEYFCVYKFTRAATNPNAGKIMLKATSLSYMSDAICEAIYQFNQSNDEYYIRYESADFSDDEAAQYYDNEDYSLTYMRDSADMTNKLAMELMAGDGPDIILDAASNSELNTSDYLVDLSEYVSKLSSDDYYTNIFDAARTGEALYQLPLSVTCNALSAPEGISPNGVGFTYEEYLNVINKYNDGVDSLRMYDGRIAIFAKLLNMLQTPVVDVNSKVNLRSDEFTALCEYCAELSEISFYEENEDEFSFCGCCGSDMPTYTINCISIYSVWDYLYNMLNSEENLQLYGLPSYDGIAPTATIETSVAISASCADVDGAWEFVEMLLQDEIMNKTSGISVSKSSMKAQSDLALKQYNDEIEENLKWYSKQELKQYGMSCEKATETDVQKALEVFENINSVDNVDSEIATIILEEIQPYFAGQKSLDEVVSIMEDKCQTVVNERG